MDRTYQLQTMNGRSSPLRRLLYCVVLLLRGLVAWKRQQQQQPANQKYSHSNPLRQQPPQEKQQNRVKKKKLCVYNEILTKQMPELPTHGISHRAGYEYSMQLGL